MHTIAGMWCIGKSNIRITTKKMQGEGFSFDN